MLLRVLFVSIYPTRGRIKQGQWSSVRRVDCQWLSVAHRYIKSVEPIWSIAINGILTVIYEKGEKIRSESENISWLKLFVELFIRFPWRVILGK